MFTKLKNMVSAKVALIRKLLVDCIDNIDAGNSVYTEKELNEIINSLTKLNKGIKRISKAYACENILHCSSSSFDNYLKLGLIPPGHKEKGFKELSWSEKDFEKVIEYRNKK